MLANAAGRRICTSIGGTLSPCRSYLERSKHAPLNHTVRYFAAPPASPPPRVIVSGIQPTGVPHIGNLLGALFNWVHLQNTSLSNSNTQLFFFIASLHALTVPQDRIDLQRQQHSMVAALLAVGIDPAKCVLFNQAHVPSHTGMFWLLSCLTSMGRLRRMTAWKSKANSSNNAVQDEDDDQADDFDTKDDDGGVSAGLLMYPVLQAGDILLYRATHVPVGHDQLQHLELTRSLARTANRHITSSSNYFPEPQPIVTPSPRIQSLRDPYVKMSKSDPDPSSRILLTDTPQEIASKIKGAVTDSIRWIEYDAEARPGVANLLTICAALENWKVNQSVEGHVTPQDVAKRLNDAEPSGKGGGSSGLKKLTTQLLIDVLEPMRQRFIQYDEDADKIERILHDGGQVAEKHASRALLTLKDSMGV